MTSQAAAYFRDTISNTAHAGGPESKPCVAVPLSRGADAHLSPIIGLSESSDEELLHQVSNRSKEALSILFHRHGRKVDSNLVSGNIRVRNIGVIC